MNNDDWSFIGIPSGMSPDIAACLNAMADAGLDDTPRLVAADMMQDIGKHDWATLIRKQCDDLQHMGRTAQFRNFSSQYWGITRPDGGKVTAEYLASVGPWCNPYWGQDRKYPIRTPLIEISSNAYHASAATVYPRFPWFRGFMSAMRNISAWTLMRVVQIGHHAWHPWDDMTFDNQDDTGRWGSVTWFKIQSQIEYINSGSGNWQCQLLVSHWNGNKWSRPRGDISFRDYSVIPEPMARFSQHLKPNESHTADRIVYRDWGEANDDLNHMARAFVREAAKQSRLRVLEVGGTHG